MQGMVDELAAKILRDVAETKSLPDEKDVVMAFKRFQAFAHQLLNEKVTPPKGDTTGSDGSAVSALLSSVNKKQASSRISKEDVIRNISTISDRIVDAPSIFITADILKAYISLQSLLGQPQRFPHVLRLYREKPVPRASSSAPYLELSEQNPSSPSTAIPPDIADAALQGAIKLHDLRLAISIIDETYCTTSYARNKTLRSALFPFAGAVLTPLAAYSLASRFALLQNTMDNSQATGVATAGIMTYVAAVGTIGYVALTTANDQMRRVTWAQGMPLWQRWVREEERAAVDRVAQAWGLSSQDRWGDEEGKDWDELREWIGLRGMILDKVELMEGME